MTELQALNKQANNPNAPEQSQAILVLDLLTDPKLYFEVLDAPAEFQTYTQWVEWKLNHLK
ncbi:hypothetical protein H6G36_02735 [Anabaena minutissima FACHB-250]|nr:hypothetical protein [Anabaena minutissima FACHB-250]